MRSTRIRRITGISFVIAMTLFSSAALRAAEATTRPDGLLRQKLEKTLDKVDLKAEPLEKLLAYLADETGVNIAVNWRSLEGAGIKTDAPITLSLKKISARIVLKEALAQAGGSTKIGYCFSDGLIRVSTLDEISQDVVTRVYDVKDLVRGAAEDSEPGASGRSAPHGAVTGESIEGLLRLIEESIDPPSWRDSGGSRGSIRAFGGKLVVTQTAETQDQIVELLAALRQKQK